MTGKIPIFRDKTNPVTFRPPHIFFTFSPNFPATVFELAPDLSGFPHFPKKWHTNRAQDLNVKKSTFTAEKQKTRRRHGRFDATRMTS